MAPRSWVMTIKRNPILMFCFLQNLKRVRIRQALKLRLSNTYSVWDLAFSGAVFGDNSDQADSDFEVLLLPKLKTSTYSTSFEAKTVEYVLGLGFGLFWSRVWRQF
jgi:hypothetical protein